MGQLPSHQSRSSAAGATWIVIPNRDGAAWLEACLETLRVTTPRSVTTLIVDNASSDNSVEVARRRLPGSRLLCLERNLGFVLASNLGVALALQEGARAVVLLNNDTALTPDWLWSIEAAARDNPSFGVLGPLQKDFDGKPSPRVRAIVERWSRSGAEAEGSVLETDWVEGSCFWIRRDVIEAIGPLDPIFAPGYFEELDFCRRARRAGFRVGLVATATIAHHGAGSAAVARRRLSVIERNYLLYHATDPAQASGALWWPVTRRAAMRAAKQLVKAAVTPLDVARAGAGVMKRWPAIVQKLRRDRAGVACPFLGTGLTSSAELECYAQWLWRIQSAADGIREAA